MALAANLSRTREVVTEDVRGAFDLLSAAEGPG
jgi:hypothetical protein